MRLEKVEKIANWVMFSLSILVLLLMIIVLVVLNDIDEKVLKISPEALVVSLNKRYQAELAILTEKYNNLQTQYSQDIKRYEKLNTVLAEKNGKLLQQVDSLKEENHKLKEASNGNGQ